MKGKNWKLETVDCKWCNTPFSRENPRKVFCSQACRHKEWYSHPENKEDKKRRSANWSDENPQGVFKRRLKRHYGITPDQYEVMNNAQNGVCKICKQICPTGRRLSVDHSHVTGKIRGLLCMRCNNGLGSFNDNIPNILAAVDYLKESV